MSKILSLCRAVAAAALAGGAIALSTPAPTQAAPITIPFDFATDLPTTVAKIFGTNGTLNFSLDLGDPTSEFVFGNFSMDIYAADNTVLGSISLAPFTSLAPAPFKDLGDAAASPTDELFNQSIWFFNVPSPALPLSLVVTSQLGTLGDPFSPLLTVDVSGDLTVAVPLGSSGQLAISIAFLLLMCSRGLRQYFVDISRSTST